MQLLRQRKRINYLQTIILHGLKPDQVKLMVDKTHVKRRVMNKNFGIFYERQKFSANFLEQRFITQKFLSQPMYSQCTLVAFTPGVEVAMKMTTGQTPITYFNRRYLDNAMSLCRIQAGCFSIKKYVAHNLSG